MGSFLNEQRHELDSPRPVSLGLVVLAGWSFLLSTVGQAYFLFTSPVLSSEYLYVSSADMIGFFVAFLSIVGGSWLATLAIPQKIRLNTEARSPILDTFLNEKRAVEMESRAEKDAYIRSAQATYIPYFIAGNICLGESHSGQRERQPLTSHTFLSGAWSLCSISGFHVVSQLALLANLIIQNYAIFIALHNWRHPDLGMSQETWRMHVLSKGNAALAVLSLWANSGILEVSSGVLIPERAMELTSLNPQKLATPTFPEMLNNGTIFILMVSSGRVPLHLAMP